MSALRLTLIAALFAASAVRAEVPDGFTFAAGGDLIGPYHPLKGQDDATLVRLKALFAKADVVFVNHEGSTFDRGSFTGAPAAENGGGIPLMPPAAIADLRAAGITLMSKANNHATDWGTEGLVATLGSLKRLDVTVAGAGEGEGEARAPGYLVTRRTRVALVDCASTFTAMSVAGAPVLNHGAPTRSRPGISALHVQQVRLVTPEQLATLRAVAGPGQGGKGGAVRLGEAVFRASDHPGDSTWEMNAADEAAILAAVKEAKAHADVVVFSIHAHETASGADDPRPADFEPNLFHAAIEAGADVVVRNGPHGLNGIELYRGRPIFYSLGSLFFDFQGRKSFGGLTFPDGWYETIVPVVTFRRGLAAEIRLHPLQIESSDGPTGGAPHTPPPDQARAILEHLKAMSAPFGVIVEMAGGEGVIRPSGQM